MRFHPHSWHGFPELGIVAAGGGLPHDELFIFEAARRGIYVVTVLSTPPQMYDPCHSSSKCHGLYRAVCGLVSVNKVPSINLVELLGQYAICMAVKILVI
jgi:hypothetical protein